ncbi:MAG: hypothetical protein COA94_09110, partial [Rickettsiales bacterium]
MTRPAGEPIGPSEDTALGPGILETIEANVRVMGIRSTARARRLMQCRAFYVGSHHDHLSRRWDGSARDPGVGYLHERLKPQGFVPVQSIPYGQRKPDTGMPLARQIINRFSEMLLGQGRAPGLSIPADVDTERYLEAVFSEAMCWDVLMEARDVTGSCGSAAIVPSVVNGVPTAEVLMPFDIHVYRWKNGASWEPLEVVEQRLVDRVVPDPETGKLDVQQYWRTRMWTETHTVTFDDVPQNWPPEDPIPYRPENRVEHHAGRCPVVWYQNTRSSKSPDGAADCDGVWHLIDQTDRIMSQVYKAARANVDPMLHIKEEERLKKKIGAVTKGGLVMTSAAGDAKYVEMEGTSISVGLEVVRTLRQEVLQTAECIIVDPASAGAYKTGEALQLLWRAMEAKTNRLRVMLTQTIRELSRIWLSLGRAVGVANLEDAKPGNGILLPPVVELVEQTTEEIVAGERPTPNLTTQSVGTGAHITFKWPPYWNPTAKQVNEMALAMGAAKNASLLSSSTRVTEMAKLLGIDPGDEFVKVKREQLEAQQKAEDDFEKEVDRMETQGTAAAAVLPPPLP